jgi:uncharacterized membrane protein
MRRLAYACWMVLSLAACSQASDTPAQGPTPPADAPASPRAPNVPASPISAPAPATAEPDFGKDINAVGTEPFWAIDIRRTTMTLAGPDREETAFTHGGPALQNGSAVFQGRAGDRPMTVTLTVEACSDGMSDLTYPYKARAELAGEALSGCAAPVDAWPKQPPVDGTGAAAPAAK